MDGTFQDNGQAMREADLAHKSDSALEPLLVVQDLHKAYASASGSVPVLQGVSLNARAGDLIALTGESGSGKSTLLHLIGALDGFDQGEIKFLGRPYSALRHDERSALRRQHIGIVFQQFNLISSLTVRDNLDFQARLTAKPDPDWISRLGTTLGLTDLLDRYPEQLSGGQQQRVAIGRAFAGQPSLILADEPTGNLDTETSDSVIQLAVDLVEETGACFLMVTHSERIASRMKQRYHLDRGQIQSV